MNYYSKENRYLLSQSHEKREKGLVMKKKIIKRTLLVLLWTAIIIAIYIFPYPAIFMANSLPKQPELSTSEKKYFEKLRKQSWNEIDRMYMNIDSLGRDIMIRNIPIDFSSKYIYTISLGTEDTIFYFNNNTQEHAFTIAKYVRDSICFKSPNLANIEVVIEYNHPTEKSGNSDKYKYYKFDLHKDSISLGHNYIIMPN